MTKESKNLGEVTQEDSIEIIKEGYPLFFKSGKWILEDRSDVIGEPTKHLSSKRKAYFFWFSNDDIEIVNEETPLDLESHNYDVNYKCYIKAAELGYYIPTLSELLESQLQNKVDERECECCGNKSDAGSQIFVCEDCLINPVITITN